jgi:hypothetical protein
MMDDSIAQEGFVTERPEAKALRYRIIWNRAGASVERIDLAPSLGEMFAGMLLERASKTHAVAPPRVQVVEPNALSLNRHERRAAPHHRMG